jgi:hypothetical protein
LPLFIEKRVVLTSSEIFLLEGVGSFLQEQGLEIGHYLKDFLDGASLKGREKGFKETYPYLCFFWKGTNPSSFFILELPNSI